MDAPAFQDAAARRAVIYRLIGTSLRVLGCGERVRRPSAAAPCSAPAPAARSDASRNPAPAPRHGDGRTGEAAAPALQPSSSTIYEHLSDMAGMRSGSTKMQGAGKRLSLSTAYGNGLTYDAAGASLADRISASAPTRSWWSKRPSNPGRLPLPDLQQPTGASRTCGNGARCGVMYVREAT